MEFTMLLRYVRIMKLMLIIFILYGQCSRERIQLKVISKKTVFTGLHDRLVGLVVRRSPRERKVPGSNPACAEIFPGSRHTSDLKIGTPVATLLGAWHYRVCAGTGRSGVSIL